MFPHLFHELVARDTERVVPYTVDLHVDADYFVPHRHNYIEFSYVIRGNGTESVNGILHPLTPGTFSLLLPSQVHALHSDAANPITFYVGGISLEKVFGSDETGGGIERLLLNAAETLPAHVLFSGEAADAMTRIFREMHGFYGKQDPWNHYLFLARLLEALVLFDLERRRQSTGQGEESETTSAMSGDQTDADEHTNGGKPARNPRLSQQTGTDFRRIIHYVQTHCSEPLTLHMLSERFHASPASISAGFRRRMGVNFVDFQHELRIRNACALLKSSSLSIVDIAMETGFGSYESFARVFRKRKGMSAAAYRHS